jgi:hypothetical protein
MGPEPDLPPLQLGVKSLDIRPYQAIPQPQTQAAEAKIQQRVIVVVNPAILGQFYACGCVWSSRRHCPPMLGKKRVGVHALHDGTWQPETPFDPPGSLMKKPSMLSRPHQLTIALFSLRSFLMLNNHPKCQ